MAGKKTLEKSDETDFSSVAKQVEDIPLENEVENSFLAYSYMVILSRAIADAKDGMKPVHRRILWSMLEEGHTPDKSHVKSMKIVGAVIGNYHTFGDSACYGAMARLAQKHSLNVPLIDPHGNMGNAPGEPPASARYTEARLSKEALQLLADIREDAVEMKPNYDSTLAEPTVLPVRFPNMLINGGSGIAVGMASNQPPHNPDEIMAAARWLLTHPNASLEKLMEFVPGPDFPTGAEIVGIDAIKTAYETGRGTIRIRSKYHVEALNRGKKMLVFTELPFEISSENIIEGTKKGLSEGKFPGIADLKDLSDRRNGTRLVVETKAGVNPDALAAALFQHTNLETSFGINNLSIVNGEPKLLGLVESLQIFIAHRKDVVLRRSAFRKKKRADRLHLVEGLIKALTNIDAVIKIVRAADDADTAQTGLVNKFKIDDIQADHILAIPLRRLTKYDAIQLEEENARLLAEIAELDKILNDEDELKRVILQEIDDTTKIISRERRSVILGGSIAQHLEEAKTALTAGTVEVEDKPCSITLLASGNIVRSEDAHTVAARGKIDPIIGSITTTTRGNFVAVTNKGTGHRVEALHASDAGKTSPKDLGLSLDKGEFIIALGRNIAEDGEAGLALGTKQGVVKIINSKDYPLRADEFPAMTLENGDEIIGGGWVADSDTTDFAFISDDTSFVRFEAGKVRPAGSKSAGVAGIKLAEGATAITFAVIEGSQKDMAEFVTYTGSTIKRSSLSLIPTKGRATGGVRSHALRKGEERLQFAAIGSSLLIVDKAGKSITLPAPTKRDAAGIPADGEPFISGSRG